MRKTVAYAFHHSIPILIGFFPVGLAYGLLMQQAGYNFLWSGACIQSYTEPISVYD